MGKENKTVKSNKHGESALLLPKEQTAHIDKAT